EQRIHRVGEACAAARLALAERRTMDVGVASPVATLPHAASDTELEVAAALEELERAFTRLPAATGFLPQGTPPAARAPVSPPPAPPRPPRAPRRGAGSRWPSNVSSRPPAPSRTRTRSGSR